MLRTAAEVAAVIVLLAGLAVVAVRSVGQDRARSAQLAAFARSRGLGYARRDTSGLLGGSFHLLRMGASRGCRDVIWGQWGGLRVRYADYWYVVPSSGEGGRIGGAARADFSIVLASLGIAAPHVEVRKHGGLTGLARHFGQPVVDVGHDRFGREFQVRSPDQQFARKLIDAPMMAWLLATGAEFGFEVAGTWLLAYCQRLEPPDLPSLLDAAAGFAAHIPQPVLDDYPATGSELKGPSPPI